MTRPARTTPRPLIARRAQLAGAAVGALLLAACGGAAPTTEPGPRHVVELPEAGPSEALPFDAATLLPDTPCDPGVMDRASCTVVSAVTGSGDALAAVVRTSRGGITTFVLAGRDGEGATWSHAPEAAPPACVGGPGPDRFACLTATPEGALWVVYETATGEESYRVQTEELAPPVVTPGIETVYSVWAGGSPGAASGTVLALGPDSERWSTPVEFEIPGAPVEAGYVVEVDGHAVVTGATVTDDDGATRLTLDAGSGAEQDGLPGAAAMDMNGLNLAYDGDTVLAGDVALDAPSGSFVAPPAAVDDPEALPATLMLADGVLAAYSADDGSELWRSAGPLNPWAACEGTLVGTSGDALSAVSLDSGEERWNAAGAVGNVSFAWCSPGAAVILDGTPIELPAPAPGEAAEGGLPAELDDVPAPVGLTDQRLAGFSLEDGSLLWELPLELPDGAEVISVEPAGAEVDRITLLVMGAEVTPDGQIANRLLSIR